MVLLLCASAWMLSHSYLGLFHDAGLYTLQALARLNPASLSQDVFLRLGSQDRFTLFSPLYAGAGKWFGIETAAATLTFVFQMTLFAAAWALARAVMPARMALYGLAVFIAIPGDYGTDRIFTCVEQFLTPRMAAEALVLASLAAAFSAHRWLALAIIGLAALLHPIMAGAGVVALLCLHGTSNSRFGVHLRVVVAALAIAVAALTAATIVKPAVLWGQFDAVWLDLVRERSPYLFLSRWQLDDWARVAVTVTTLTAGLIAPSGNRVHSLCRASLVTIAVGFALTYIGGDQLHLVLFTQMQPWRWQWLGTVTAGLLLPMILSDRWAAGVSGRTTALLLVAAWIFGLDNFALIASTAALASLAWGARLKASEARLVFWGAFALLAVAIIWRLASNLQFTDAHYLDSKIPLWMRRSMSFSRDGAAPMAMVLVAWCLARARSISGLVVFAILATVGALALAPQSWTRWTLREFPEALVAQFATWRERIPPGSNVFWPQSPLDVWLLLDRPNYLSLLQSSGMVFSRETAVEIQRRAAVLAPFLPPPLFLNWRQGTPNMELSLQQLQGVCRLGAFDYLVTTANLGVRPLETISRATSDTSHPLQLYRCANPAG